MRNTSSCPLGALVKGVSGTFLWVPEVLLELCWVLGTAVQLVRQLECPTVVSADDLDQLQGAFTHMTNLTVRFETLASSHDSARAIKRTSDSRKGGIRNIG